jgi:hypothetical protein
MEAMDRSRDPIRKLRLQEEGRGPGEKKTVTLTLPWEARQLVDADRRRAVEPGELQALVGPCSRDRDLLKTRRRAES